MSQKKSFLERLPKKPSPKGFLKALRFGRQGLVTVVVQDALSGEILMLAHADRKAVKKTLKSGVMHYWSRSRKKIWRKGEESGNEQLLENLFVDCDGDALIAQVRQVKAACHLGYRSCFAFHADHKTGRVIVTGRKIMDPDAVYGHGKKGKPSKARPPKKAKRKQAAHATSQIQEPAQAPVQP